MVLEDGPYIQAACFCDQILEDKAGALSLIRIVDTLTHRETSPSPPEEMPPVPYILHLVLMLKSGNARGRHNLRIVPELPTGELENPIILTVHFEGEEKGQNVLLNIPFLFQIEGLYWFNVHLDDQKLTAIPFRVKYERLVIGTARQ